MTTQAPPSNLLPLNPEQLARLQAATSDFSPTQLAWVSGYFWGMLNQQPGAVAGAPATAVEIPAITLISASQTGNARRVAEALRDDLLAARLNVNQVNAGDYKFKQIASEKLLVVQGTAFNWPWPDHFRVVTLPRVDDLEMAIGRIGNFLKSYRQ